MADYQPKINFLAVFLRLHTTEVINNVILVKVNHFRYLGNMVPTTNTVDIKYKLHSFISISGIINNIFEPNDLNKFRHKIQERKVKTLTKN